MNSKELGLMLDDCSQPMEPERKYAMTKLAPGSYLLPSNDATKLFHIYRFEDGRSYGLQDEPDRMWWACARYRGSYDSAVRSVERNIDDYGYIADRDDWIEVDSYLRTRAEAVTAAMRER